MHGSAVEPKYLHFVVADEEVVQSVLEGETPGTGQDARAYVKLVNSEWEDRSGWKGGQSFPAIDGCTARDVGWMKVHAQCLFPRAYRLLQNCGWYDEYCRPPDIKGD